MSQSHQSWGILKYFPDPYKLIVEVDNEIGTYYRSLVPAYLKLKKPMYASHISVVRNMIPSNLEVWQKYQDKMVSFEYESWIYNDELYYWLNCYSTELETIRFELGLKPYGDVTESPDKRHKFHITIGNLK